MTTLTTQPSLDAAELRRLPALERDHFLEAAAAKAAAEYEIDTELSAFDAFGKDYLHGHSSATRAR